VDSELDGIRAAGFNEGVEIGWLEAHELPNFVVADALLEDESADERLADAEVGRCCGNIQQGGRLSSRGGHVRLLSPAEGRLSAS